MAVTLKKAVTDEAFEIISKKAYEIWNECYTSVITKEQIEYMTSSFQSASYIKKQVENEGYEYYTVNENEDILGYIAIKKEEKLLFLSKLYIDKKYRGKGVSRVVFEFLKEYISDNRLKGVYLTVNKNNNNSIEVYKHFGFKIIREEKNDIGNGFFMDDYIMEYRIDNTRIALISIIVEDKKSVSKLNELLSDYGEYIIGRMGIPYHKKNVSVISVAMDAPNDVINTLSGKLGSLKGVNTKTVYSNK